MPWWTSLLLLSVAVLLWLVGRGNSDDVIGLLEKLLAVTITMAVLLFGHNLLLEAVALLIAFRLPPAIKR